MHDIRFFNPLRDPQIRKSEKFIHGIRITQYAMPTRPRQNAAAPLRGPFSPRLSFYSNSFSTYLFPQTALCSKESDLPTPFLLFHFFSAASLMDLGGVGPWSEQPWLPVFFTWCW